MKTNAALLFVTLAGLGAGVSSTHAQDFSVNWNTIAGGGGHSTGGVFVLDGTSGQMAPTLSTGGGFRLQGGFWAAFTGEPTPNTPALRIQLANHRAVLTWPSLSGGFNLEQTSAWPGGWSTVPGAPVLNPNNENEVVLPLEPGSRYFRLRK